MKCAVFVYLIDPFRQKYVRSKKLIFRYAAINIIRIMVYHSVAGNAPGPKLFTSIRLHSKKIKSD